jgi:undecaprenyl pyrophosphate phosphatase UppP
LALKKAMHFIQIIVAVLLTVFFGLFVRRFVERVTRDIELPPPKKVKPEDWEKVYKPGKDQLATKWMGVLECFVFLAGFWLEKPVIIAGWLAFKVATKWEVWKNIIQVPVTFGKDELSYLQSRSALGSWVFIRFLIGTLANLLIALVATYLGKLVSW